MLNVFASSPLNANGFRQIHCAAAGADLPGAPVGHQRVHVCQLRRVHEPALHSVLRTFGLQQVPGGQALRERPYERDLMPPMRQNGRPDILSEAGRERGFER